MNLKFAGKSTNRIPALYPNEKARFLEYFSKKKDFEFDLVVKRKKTARSIEQNNYIHWAFTFVADELQLTMDIIKRKAKSALLLVPESEVIKRLVNSYEGDDKEAYQKMLYNIELPEVVRDTSDLDVPEMSSFIEALIPWFMNTFKIAVPYPNEVDV